MAFLHNVGNMLRRRGTSQYEPIEAQTREHSDVSAHPEGDSISLSREVPARQNSPPSHFAFRLNREELAFGIVYPKIGPLATYRQANLAQRLHDASIRVIAEAPDDSYAKGVYYEADSGFEISAYREPTGGVALHVYQCEGLFDKTPRLGKYSLREARDHLLSVMQHIELTTEVWDKERKCWSVWPHEKFLLFDERLVRNAYPQLVSEMSTTPTGRTQSQKWYTLEESYHLLTQHLANAQG